MEYWKVHWHHEFESEPTLLYCEIGEDGYEVRKVQKYRNGMALKADELHESGDVGLSEIPVGPLKDVVSQAEFSALYITADEFEREWGIASWSRRCSSCPAEGGGQVVGEWLT